MNALKALQVASTSLIALGLWAVGIPLLVAGAFLIIVACCITEDGA